MAAQRVETGRPECWAALGKSLTISEPWFPQPPNLEMGFHDPQGPLWFSKSMIIIVSGTPQFGVAQLRSRLPFGPRSQASLGLGEPRPALPSF